MNLVLRTRTYLRSHKFKKEQNCEIRHFNKTTKNMCMSWKLQNEIELSCAWTKVTGITRLPELLNYKRLDFQNLPHFWKYWSNVLCCVVWWQGLWIALYSQICKHLSKATSLNSSQYFLQAIFFHAYCLLIWQMVYAFWCHFHMTWVIIMKCGVI